MFHCCLLKIGEARGELPGPVRSCPCLNRFASLLSGLDQHQGHSAPSPPILHHALLLCSWCTAVVCVVVMSRSGRVEGGGCVVNIPTSRFRHANENLEHPGRVCQRVHILKEGYIFYFFRVYPSGIQYCCCKKTKKNDPYTKKKKCGCHSSCEGER